MHTWPTPWPLEIRKALDTLAIQEEKAIGAGYIEVGDQIMYLYDCIVSEFDLTMNARQARQNQEGP
jgi:hypothetical protein